MDIEPMFVCLMVFEIGRAYVITIYHILVTIGVSVGCVLEIKYTTCPVDGAYL